MAEQPFCAFFGFPFVYFWLTQVGLSLTSSVYDNGAVTIRKPRLWTLTVRDLETAARRQIGPDDHHHGVWRGDRVLNRPLFPRLPRGGERVGVNPFRVDGLRQLAGIRTA